MSFFECGRNIIAQVPGDAFIGFLQSGHVQSRIENEVDELMQAGERQAQSAANALQAGSADGGGNLMVWVLVGVIILIALLMLWFLGRIVRNNRDAQENVGDTPHFEDQFAVHDEEISIVTEETEDGDDESLQAAYEEPVLDTAASFSDSEEPQEYGFYSSSDDTASGQYHDDEESLEYHEEAEAPTDEHDAGEDAEVHASEDYPEDYHDSENIIHLTSRSDQTDEDELEEEAEPETDYAAHYEAHEEEEQAVEHDEVEQADNNVRYAFAATPRSPMSFSGISEDEPEDKPEWAEPERVQTDEYRSRPYIAPTVLREDMEKMEQHQAERIDHLREDMTRQITSMKAENNNRLDLIINALDRKIENLADLTRQGQQESIQPVAGLPPEITGKISSLQSSLDNQGQRIRAITQILDDRLDSVSHVYGEVRSISERIEAFTNKLDKLEQSIIDRAHQDVMADVQLSDVIRSSLSPEDYEFKALLTNNNRADCLIRLPHPPGAIVIDTRFPLDAFNALPAREDVARGTAQAKAAEDSFRRSVLRHIIDVAERYIVPGETADSALLFLPTEAIYTSLHARFPDLVRDSFRARVWIVSPSTLMGTLQTLRGVLRDNKDRSTAEAVRREADEAMSEVEALRSRASVLAENFEKTQGELRSLLEATNKVVTRTGTARQTEPSSSHAVHHALMDHLYDNKPEWPGRSADQQRDRGQRQPTLYDDKNPRPDNLR
ncbi:DNA recombination protein RmuC [Parvularcula sp. IMCC14364]|uniref:DNA recombination protein RmuC n=1 Tax=Parvularcula sp. IMCC14364 TaxID=3067902 RepID=UPI002742700B|nr:DNA recombination protein RmuC [Parvularcula sp. IMCC14364]